MRRSLALSLILVLGCADERARPGAGNRRGSDAGSTATSSDAAVIDPSDDAAASIDSGLDDRASITLDARVPSDGGPNMCTDAGAISGRVCAPAEREWVAGAIVSVEAIDCNGVRVTITATSGPDGSFRLENVPSGAWTVKAVAGAFSQTYQVTVSEGREEIIPVDALCVQQDVVRVAVITGFGDRIENLLTNVGIQFDTFDGNAGWSTSAAPFLSDPLQLERYDLIFIDCAAATNLYTVDLGPSATLIVDNLRRYVMNGGSLYASDWAVTFLALAFPSIVRPDLRNVNMVTSPFEATELSGYAPQTIMAQVTDPSLARAIGASTVPITFPDATGARSGNWGLLDLAGTQATVLVEGQAITCSQGAVVCNAQSAPGPTVTAPLAIKFKLTPATERGGNVFYTAFHNIAQTGTGVADILRWIVFRL